MRRTTWICDTNGEKGGEPADVLVVSNDKEHDAKTE